MAASNHERVGRALQIVQRALQPYIEREMRSRFGKNWEFKAKEVLREDWTGGVNWDVQAQLKLMWELWSDVFSKQLGPTERGLVGELRGVRNNWAHQKAFTLDDAYRALDTAHRLLTAIASPEAEELDRQKQEILRMRYEQQAHSEARRIASGAIGADLDTSLPPWRDVVAPHDDVAQGVYLQSEFAADLNQVYKGEASDEYGDPQLFFERTYITEGLRRLLGNALRRLSGIGGDPVVQLQTNFGGGKTHSMIALYHLFSGANPLELPGVESIVQDLGISQIPRVRRAVLVGYALSPADSTRKPDGTVVRTMWGELAWQLLGREGYELVANADSAGVNPGSDRLKELFSRAQPCLILIDEWVTFLRTLYGVSGMPAGSFDSNLSFVQSLTEAVRASERTLLVATLPASQVEVGGEGGQQALERLQRTFGRVEATWRPADMEESFEIVRRRLFKPITESNLLRRRDAVAKAFVKYYRDNRQDFPSECSEAAYEDRIKRAYPIHPELFERLYDDWAALEDFQRTRGVLRLMSAVVHHLWAKNDRSPLIMPANIPLDEQAVRSELTRYLESNWQSIIDQDIDGPGSVPVRLDLANPTFGRYSACRRVSRTIFMGSAPTYNRPNNRGIDPVRIRLGCAFPGERVAVFGDALNRLQEESSYLFYDAGRYWYGTSPTVSKIARDRASQQSDEDVLYEIERRLERQRGGRGLFVSVHVCPSSSADVPDTHDAKLVILPPRYVHSRNDDQSEAMARAREFLEHRGQQPRMNRNTLVFLAADKNGLESLKGSVRQYLAWRSIVDEAESLNLDQYGMRQAAKRKEDLEKEIEHKIPEAYCWLLIPEHSQEDRNKYQLREARISRNATLAEAASNHLQREGILLDQMAPTVLRKDLDNIPLWQGDHLSVRDLLDYYARYLYLPKVKNDDVLLDAIRLGVNRANWEETFAYAEGYDAQRNRYEGLTVNASVSPLPSGLLVKPEVAKRQLDAERAVERSASVGVTPLSQDERQRPIYDEHEGEPTLPVRESVQTKPRYRRYFGEFSLEPDSFSKQSMTVFQEVIQHVAALVGADVKITLHVDVDAPEGIPEDVRQVLSENSRTLRGKFDFSSE